MPTKRVFAAAVGVEKRLYVIGGCDAKGMPMGSFESLDLSKANKKKAKWDRLQDLSTCRAGVSAVVIENKILTFGGVDQQQNAVDCVEIYDTQRNQWIECDTMNEKLMGVSVVVRDKKVFVVGGMGVDKNPRDYMMFYNPEIDKWGKIKAPMNTSRYAASAFHLKDVIYVLGGRQGKQAVAAVECYDLRAGKWNQLKDIPSKRVFAHYTASDDNIYSVGGLNEDANKGFSDAMEIYDFRADEWMIGQPCPTKRGDFAIGFMNGEVIAAGGLGNEGKPMAAVDSYNLSTDSWTSLQPMPHAHCSCAYTMFNDQLYVAGGMTTGGIAGQVETLSYLGSQDTKS